MNENYGNNNFGYDGYTEEPDYYTLYTEQKTREARGVFSRCHLALFLYLLIPSVLVTVAEIIMISILGVDGTSKLLSDNMYLTWILGFAPSYLIGFPILYLLVRNVRTAPIKKSKMRISEFFVLFLIAEAVMTIGSLIGQSFNNFISAITGKEVVDYTSNLIAGSSIWLIIPVVVILAPIVEELIFRKLFMDRFSRYGNGIAIVVSALGFALFHGNFYQFFYALGLGMILGYVYAKTRNVIYPIVMHSIINFLGSVATLPVVERMDGFYEALEKIADGIEVDMARFLQDAMIIGSYTILQYAMLGAGIALLINYIKKRKFKLSGSWEFQIAKERRSNVLFVNAGTIAFFALSVTQILYTIIFL